MKRTIESIESQYSKFEKSFKEIRSSTPGKQPLSLDQMAKRARQIAVGHSVTLADTHELLLDKLHENEVILHQVHDSLVTAVHNKEPITPAAEWILDNFYLIDEQIRLSKRYLPKGYSRGLPKLITTDGTGQPRVLEVINHIIDYSDAHTDIHSLSTFIHAYQEKQELTLGELWAIPIMLRFALIENLSNVAIRVVFDRKQSDLGAYWANKIIAIAEVDPTKIVLTLADMARADISLHSSFVTEFHKRINASSSSSTLPIIFLEQKLALENLSVNLMISDHGQRQAQDQVSVTNSINSLRYLAKLDWREFVESASLVEKTLREDSNGVYASMDFLSRDQYRHQVEEIAKQSRFSENEVARIAIDLSKDASRHEKIDKRAAHVGYFLVGKGRKTLESFVGVKRPLFQSIKTGITNNWHAIYFILFIIFTGALSWLLYSAFDLSFNTFTSLLLAALSVLVSSQISTSLTNWISTLVIAPSRLPKMDFSKLIPEAAKTMIAIPTLLVNKRQSEKIVGDLEVRYLANPDNALLYALVTDFEDADFEISTADTDLLKHLEDQIKNLNEKYCTATQEQFFLFHRPRLWNEGEKKWMGYERKRGKLGDLNHVLRGKGREKFLSIVGPASRFVGTKYVITLDSDTQLPRESAWKLIGILQHPLNAPFINENNNVVTDGYGIIQPRVAISLHGSPRSLYSKLSENDVGIDPYTGEVSDVYQDVFKEGSFIGKGIYDVDVFEKCLHGRFPENTILSHDLLEGSYIRCGYASDVQLYEENPSSFLADIKRKHRWIRGDWQIASWIFPSVPSAKRKNEANPINGLSRWKIFDNLRRSIVPIALLVILLSGLLVAFDTAKFLLTFSLIILLPALIAHTWSAFHKEKELNFATHVKRIFGDLGKSIFSTLLMIAFLPYEAAVNADAIVRALWRMVVSKRNRLQWMPSSFVESKHASSSIYAKMIINPIAAIATLLLLLYIDSPSLLMISPILLAWFIAPGIANLISRPLKTKQESLTATENLYLKKLARKTWAFYDQLLNESDNWLPPDNIQEYPIPVIAHRTSPTNIGITLLSNLTAYDFGYSPIQELITRTQKTFDTLHKLERYKGHFFNWYDTQSLQVLFPRYISTVDSGNFAGHVLTLRQGLLEIKKRPLLEPRLKDALYDTVNILEEVCPPDAKAALAQFSKHLNDLKIFKFTTIQGWKNYTDDVRKHFAVLEPLVSQYPTVAFQDWMDAFSKQLSSLESQVQFLSNWQHITTMFPLSTGFEVPEIPSLQQMADFSKQLATLQNFSRTENADGLQIDIIILQEVANTSSQILADVDQLIKQCSEFADIAFDFLYDKSHRLLTIGYNVDTHQRDSSYYDLLASEARLSSFVAIAQGKIPQESWFALGRRLTSSDGTPTLMSWSGSMFEYLMPLLVMPSYEDTLLDETHIGSIQLQIEFARKNGIPWGISESCYNVVDSHLTYQYKAFGVPDLGFKRGLDKEFVIAPYATVMALMVEPKKSYDNLINMRGLGYEGRYGFFESIEYTPSRLPRNKQPVVIQTFMAHHQGMGFLALNYLLNNRPMQRRFEADPQLQTALLLLQERLPKAVGMVAKTDDAEEIIHATSEGEVRVIKNLDSAVPEVQLLSNGRYHVMVSQSGGGYSRWRDLAITRWREDGTRDHWGTFCYVKDLDSGSFFSNTFQPTAKTEGHYEAIFSQGRAEFRRHELNLECHTEIIVSPEDDVELRRLKIINSSDQPRSIAITSYTELVIAAQAADTAHPAFSNLFVQTEILEQSGAIIGTRRARTNEEIPPWSFCLLKSSERSDQNSSFETDRMKFIGRGRTLARPKAITEGTMLSGSAGSVLDPIAAIQSRFVIGPGERITIDLVLGMATTRDNVMALVDKFQDQHLRDRAFDLSWTHSQVALRQINASETQAQLFTKIASSIIYSNAQARSKSEILLKNNSGQSNLWRYSISGDLPIVLLTVADVNNITLVGQLVRARAYWQLKGLSVDLVILNEDRSGYRQVLQEHVQNIINALPIPNVHDKQGNVFVRSTDNMSTEDIILLQSVARIVFKDDGRSLHEQVLRHLSYKPKVSDTITTSKSKTPPVINKISLPANGLFNNSYGCFSEDGTEYLIKVDNQIQTPLPWINVIANKSIGTIVSESGQSYTWFENAQMFRLSPWSNDPVTDATGELFYIRDDENGRFWSPTPWPAKNSSDYLIRHGFGYSIFEHTHDNIATSVTTFVDVNDPVKFNRITIKNTSDRPRKISFVSYVEWVLGTLRPQNAMHVVTERSINGGMIARNPYNSDFHGYVAFCKLLEAPQSFTCDRREFLGRHGTYASPNALKHNAFSNALGAGLDPCTAILSYCELLPGEEREFMFMIGAERDRAGAEALLKKYHHNQTATISLLESIKYWKVLLGTVQIETPDKAVNILANGWLIYQVLSCRFWGRSGFYQSGGAFGFRDQLQDSIALLHAEPIMTRDQILKSASRQFIEGDVQHWWHPPTNRGVRTLCSDDFLWLPYVTSRYVEATGDFSILEEEINFIEGRPLNTHEESYYDQPNVSFHKSTLYEHCKLAINRALKHTGVHGLPLIGSGDWNDGMNMVGIEGKGESVWLGFFLYNVINRFMPLVEHIGQEEIKTVYTQEALQLKSNLNKHGWGGKWFLRAYFDNGQALGIPDNDECKIDSIAQSWSLLSGAGDSEKVSSAMDSAFEYLVNKEKAIIQLLDPPFDKSAMNPGYIKGYLPGVRENGGQYTHAAIWLVMAFAQQKDHERTWSLLQTINPINHGTAKHEVDVYKVEPYVLAADVYGVAPHIGRGGWTWYTGSAGWMYQLILEHLLGVRRVGNKIEINPCIPKHWDKFSFSYQYGDVRYQVEVNNPAGEQPTISVNGVRLKEQYFVLEHDAASDKIPVTSPK